jgi:prevent-host-death family protein
MAEHQYSIEMLRAELEAALDLVETRGDTVVVTREGRPVARLVPAPGAGRADLRGSVTFAADYRPDEGTGAAWSAATA